MSPSTRSRRIGSHVSSFCPCVKCHPELQTQGFPNPIVPGVFQVMTEYLPGWNRVPTPFADLSSSFAFSPHSSVRELIRRLAPQRLERDGAAQRSDWYGQGRGCTVIREPSYKGHSKQTNTRKGQEESDTAENITNARVVAAAGNHGPCPIACITLQTVSPPCENHEWIQTSYPGCCLDHSFGC